MNSLPKPSGTPARRSMKATRPALVAIKPLRLDLHLSERTPTLWFGQNPVLCHFMNAFSGLFPLGERQMISVVRKFRDRVRDDKVLNQEVSGFIGQEAHHAHSHEVLNRMLLARGVPMDNIDAIIGWGIAITEKLPERQQMALVGAAEHFTALFGGLVLENPEILDLVHPDIRPMWIWHAMEELEHKAVTYDLYYAVGGNYPERVAAYTAFSLLLFSMIAAGTVRLAAADRSLFSVRATSGALWWMFGIGRKAGYFRKNVLKPLLDFYRPGFHPWNHDNSALIEKWQPVLQEILGRRQPQGVPGGVLEVPLSSMP